MYKSVGSNVSFNYHYLHQEVLVYMCNVLSNVSFLYQDLHKGLVLCIVMFTESMESNASNVLRMWKIMGIFHCMARY